MKLRSSRSCALLILGALSLGLVAARDAFADPFIAPGRTELRVDIETLADAGVITGPVTTWPLNWQSIIGGLEDADRTTLTPAASLALARIQSELDLAEQTQRLLPHVRIGAASDPILVRSFAATPREDGELEGGISYTGDRLSFKLNLTRTFDASDNWRADGSYVGFAVRQWAVIAGYPERWWGPGIQGSLILSTNARPFPQIGVERISTNGFRQRWLRWLGPWTVSSFIGELDDDRVVERAKIFGFRVTAKPLPQLEIGFSRAAQLCGNGRPCGLRQFSDMLLGKDNSGRNVSAADEPGNQLAGMDGRWSFRGNPFAVYWQWIGEDTRQGGPQIGSWLRMIGAEYTGDIASTSWRHRTYFEIANTACQEGSIGTGGAKYGCAYQHGKYRTGYRYEGRPLGYVTDTDSESLAIVSQLSGPGTSAWELGAYTMQVNQGPAPVALQSISPAAPAHREGLDIAHLRDLPLGRMRVRLSLWKQRDETTRLSTSDASLAFEWMVGYW